MNYRSRKNYLRAHVFARDRGVCAHCGLDAEKLDRVARIMANDTFPPAENWHYIYRHTDCYDARPESAFDRYRLFLAKLGFGHMTQIRSLWQMDHIIPHCEGGPCTLDNLRTLCRPCHKAESAELMKRVNRTIKETGKYNALA